jgi:hypothetical protein
MTYQKRSFRFRMFPQERSDRSACHPLAHERDMKVLRGPEEGHDVRMAQASPHDELVQISL